MDLLRCTSNLTFGPRLICLCITGEWHQYDDIICAEPSKSIIKRLKDSFWPDQRKSVIEGREIAGQVMLETIFDFLRSWTDINLRNFITQLRQFHQIYGNPFVFEEKEKKWSALNYTETDVSRTLLGCNLDATSTKLFPCFNTKHV